MGYTVPGWEMQFEAYIELHFRFKYEKNIYAYKYMHSIINSFRDTIR